MYNFVAFFTVRKKDSFFLSSCCPVKFFVPTHSEYGMEYKNNTKNTAMINAVTMSMKKKSIFANIHINPSITNHLLFASIHENKLLINRGDKK